MDLYFGKNLDITIQGSNAIKLLEFYEYVCLFYSLEYGIYKIASCQEIIKAIDKYCSEKKLSELYFDSVDREIIRCIIDKNYFSNLKTL